jgi:hypothetical protein
MVIAFPSAQLGGKPFSLLDIALLYPSSDDNKVEFCGIVSTAESFLSA